MFLETERLILRKFRKEDFSDFWEFANDPEMCRMMGRDDMSDPENARFTFDWLMNKEERGYVLVCKETGKVMGNLTVTQPPANVSSLPQLEGKTGRALSFSISRHYQRRGLMYEMAAAVIDHLFQAEGVDYINCGHFDFNHPSQALQKKLGFTHLLTDRLEDNGEEIICIENILWNP